MICPLSSRQVNIFEGKKTFCVRKSYGKIKYAKEENFIDHERIIGKVG